MNATVQKADLYARVTDRIVATLESGTRPWLKPWSTDHDTSASLLPMRGNGVPYRGINVLLLWGDAIDKGFSSRTWMTYKQAEACGANVRKGERGSMVVYADKVSKTETNDKGEDIERAFAFMKSYTVFNAEQIENLPVRDEPVLLPPGDDLVAHQGAEDFFARTGADFRHGGNHAFYSTAGDFIQLPPLLAFKDSESYAATKAHELVHWTGHDARLARTFGKRFGDHAYAAEELVAELGAAFLCAALGVTPEPRDDHAAYLASWLQILKADKRAIFTAAASAQAAADFLAGFQGAAISTGGEALSA